MSKYFGYHKEFGGVWGFGTLFIRGRLWHMADNTRDRLATDQRGLALRVVLETKKTEF